jgi:ubiquinone/menaquinone biosynthesis C-methylase UbiE
MGRTLYYVKGGAAFEDSTVSTPCFLPAGNFNPAFNNAPLPCTNQAGAVIPSGDGFSGCGQSRIVLVLTIAVAVVGTNRCLGPFSENPHLIFGAAPAGCAGLDVELCCRRMSDTAEFYEKIYKSTGYDAQRRYPNEELCRFMGRRYFNLPRDRRAEVKILEVGCGSGANLWMIADEGFDAFGLDLSKEGVELCRRLLNQKRLKATIVAEDMTATSLESGHFDAIIDVFSSNSLQENSYLDFVSETKRLLKSGGRFFSYTPSQASDAFINYKPSICLTQCSQQTSA